VDVLVELKITLTKSNFKFRLGLREHSLPSALSSTFHLWSQATCYSPWNSLAQV
jgi:hypothetical protein